jgi:subfamily B ATP-binding cassette protein MsbA
MTTTTPPTQWALFLRLLRYVQPYRTGFALAILCMVASAATEPVFPAIMKEMLDSGFKQTNPTMIWLIPAGIVGLFVVRAVFSFCSSYLMTWVASGLIADIRRHVFARILKLPTQRFHDESAARLSSRILYEIHNVSDLVTTILIAAVREFFTVVALMGYLIYLDWSLTLITLAVGPLLVLIAKGFGKRMRAASKNSILVWRDLAHAIEESIRAHKIIKIFNAQPQQVERIRLQTGRFRRTTMKEAVPAAAVTPITHIAAAIAVAIITYLALSGATGGAGTSAGNFVAFISALLMLIAPVKQLTNLHTSMQKGLVSCTGVFELLDSEAEHDQGTRQLAKCHGHIQFHDVGFCYPETERQVLQHIELDIVPGSTVALVGGSGGGKSTVASLIPRLYDPTQGRITLDGTDLREFTLESLRRQISIVSQETVLFNDSVYANIAFGCEPAPTREAVMQAARAAHAAEFIESLPEGLDTPIGEGGARLSGGQRQRLAIARALLKNAPILILDEATSALDAESERYVQDALQTLMAHRTTLVIAHRLSTVEKADRIVVIHHGRILESGTHSELMQRDGAYAKLYGIQLAADVIEMGEART